MRYTFGEEEINNLFSILKKDIESNNTKGNIYELDADMECSGLIDFAPLGNAAKYSFRGVLDGKGHKIKDLKINTPRTYELGLFNTIGRDGKVKNLFLESITIEQNLTGLGEASESTRVGAIAAVCQGEIYGCSASGEIILQAETDSCCVGGLCGSLPYTDSKISNSWADVRISFKSNNAETGEAGENNIYTAGGIVGIINGNIVSCHSRSELSGPSSEIACYIAGGICGAADPNAQVTACYNIGYLHSRGEESDTLGGITGKADKNAKFSKCLYLKGCILSNSSQKTVKVSNTIGSEKTWNELTTSGTAASELNEDYADTPAGKYSYTPYLKIIIPEDKNTLNDVYLMARCTPVAASFKQSVYPKTTNPVQVDCKLYNCSIKKVLLTAVKPDRTIDKLQLDVSGCSFSYDLGNNIYISYDFELTLTDDYERSITILDADIEMESKKESMS